jgi:hypothetical protein
MDQEMHQYSGDFTFTVTTGERGATTLSFLNSDGDVVTAIQLTRAGAEAIGVELLVAGRTK